MTTDTLITHLEETANDCRETHPAVTLVLLTLCASLSGHPHGLAVLEREASALTLEFEGSRSQSRN